MEKGYAVIDRDWKKGDVVLLNLPMDVKRVESRPELTANTDRVAIQRGPLVYCIESTDNKGQAWNVILPDNAAFTTVQKNVLTEPVIAIQTKAPSLTISSDGTNVKTEEELITAIPYYTWCNREQSQMQVWLPKKVKDLKINR
jgi:DUF1680 family protein